MRRFEEALIAGDVDMDKAFTRLEWKQLPTLLKIQIRAYRFAKEHQRRRALDAAPPSRISLSLDFPGAATETLLDKNVTRRIRASDTAGFIIDEPGVGIVRHLVDGESAETKVDLEEAE